MAVDEFYSVDSPHLINPSRTLYPQKIEINHWQLRHFISSPDPDYLYYVAEKSEVYRLNTSTKVRTHLTSLPFEVTPARCTASGHGWICVGGGDKEGQVAIIKVDESVDVDALLPLDLGSRHSPRPAFGPAPRVSVKVETLGDDIVNSVSIHKIRNDENDDDEIVAVLSNNDCTVRIYSLTHGIETAVFNMRFQMNHATISPNGQFLVAVGDFQQAYFYERVKLKRSAVKSPMGPVNFGEWEVFHIAPLHVPTGAKLAAYFTTAWSPSGGLCAVGSESGYITVFDMELLQATDTDDDAIVQLISSSRPDDGPGPGSIRSMCFAPKPWDLLVWAEDQGRICVADVRAGLRVRQVLNLDPNENGLLKINVHESYEEDLDAEARELHREAEFIQRYRRALNFASGSGVPITTEYLENAAERRRLQREPGISSLDDDHHGLTTEEAQILETLRTTRQRAEERENGNRPRSIQYTSAPFSSSNGHDVRRSNQSPPADFPSLNRERRGSIGSATNSTLSSTLRDLWRDRDHGRFQPRRQAIGASTSTPPTDPWSTIEAAMTRPPRPIDISSSARSRLPALDADLPSFPEALPNTPELQRMRRMNRARERAINLRESQIPPGSYEVEVLRRPSMRNYSRLHNMDPECGPRTAGLAMSTDGRRLWAGTEVGIFEFEVNTRLRLLFPALEPR